MSEKPMPRVFQDSMQLDLPYFCNFSVRGLKSHCHIDFYEFVIIVSGSYLHVINEQEDMIHLGKLLFFTPGQSHSLIEQGTTSTHYSFIVEENYFQEFVRKYNSNADIILSTPYVNVELSGSEIPYVAHLASILARSSAENLYAVANQLLQTLLFSCFANIPAPSSNDVSIYAVDLLRRLDSYHVINSDVTQFYEQYPVSSTTLIHDFENLTGYTIVQYRNMKRMEYAAHLLAEENYSITTVAEMLNLSNLGYFANQFREYYGMTPKQYQILHRKHAKRHSPKS